MLSHLGWSLLDRSEDSGPMISVDPPSALLARILFATFLIVGVVLLINMLIALLSNTYRKIEVKFNSLVFLRSCSNKCGVIPGGVLDISLGGEVRPGPSYPDPV